MLTEDQAEHDTGVSLPDAMNTQSRVAKVSSTPYAHRDESSRPGQTRQRRSPARYVWVRRRLMAG
eukprot:914343-Karenia_brevis.AAC.1